MRKFRGPSEFEQRGPKKTGVFGIARAWEKLRYIVRTGKDPESEAVELDATPDDWGSGGMSKPDAEYIP